MLRWPLTAAGRPARAIIRPSVAGPAGPAGGQRGKLKSKGVGPRPWCHWGAAVCHWGVSACVIGVSVRVVGVSLCVIGVSLRVSLGCLCVCHWAVVCFYPLPSTVYR